MRAGGVRRRPAHGGYARGDATRERIIQIALKLFGERGFEPVSTREIASAAAASHPALQYYFDSKEGLFAACAEHAAGLARAALEPSLRSAERALQTRASKSELIEAYLGMMGALVDFLFSNEGVVGSKFLAADQAGFGPGIAHATAKAEFGDRFDRCALAIIGRLSAGSTDLETRLRALAIHGQILAFHGNRKIAESLLGPAPLNARHGQRLKVIVLQQTGAVLAQLVAACDDAHPDEGLGR